MKSKFTQKCLKCTVKNVEIFLGATVAGSGVWGGVNWQKNTKWQKMRNETEVQADLFACKVSEWQAAAILERKRKLRFNRAPYEVSSSNNIHTHTYTCHTASLWVSTNKFSITILGNLYIRRRQQCVCVFRLRFQHNGHKFGQLCRQESWRWFPSSHLKRLPQILSAFHIHCVDSWPDTAVLNGAVT